MKKSWKFSGYLGLFVLFLGILLPVNFAFADSTGNQESIPISRLAGGDRYETAVKISQAGWTDNSSPYAVLAAGMNQNLVDALTSAPLAKLKNAPILLTQGNKLNDKTKSELQRLGATTVYVTSGLGVITQPVIDELKAMNITVTPLGGADRFATALNIANEVGFHGKLVVASASSNADALSIASIAAEQSMPILLAYQDKIPASIAAYLNSIKSDIDKTYIIGGTGVISSNVENSLTNVQRIGGADRFETNLLIIAAFSLTFPSSERDVIYLANGNNNHLVDALTGSVLAAKDSTAIVLTANPMPDKTKLFLKDIFPLDSIVAFGGDSLVPQADLEQVSTYINYPENGAVIGSTDAENPLAPTDNIQISGNDSVLQNADLPNNLYITGNNVRLSNLNVAGSVVIEPTGGGTTTLENVTAAGIALNTDATGTIKFNNVQANILHILNKEQVQLELSNNTNFDYTIIKSDATLDTGDNGTNTFGNILILGLPQADGSAPDLSVQFAGTFADPILFSSQGTITAMPGTTLEKVGIAPINKDDKITLKGQMAQVDILGKATMEIADGSAIDNITIYADTHITVKATATVGEITKENNAVLTLDGDGAPNVGGSSQ